MTQRGANYVKQAGDTYMTPAEPVLSLLNVVPIWGLVWEPACGERAIIHAIEDRCPFVQTYATDLEPKYDGRGGSDFLASSLPHSAGDPWTIITNPPYGKGGKLALAFVERALMLTILKRGKVIMLLPADWDAAKGRQHLFEHFQGHVTKVTLTQRIRWTNIPQAKSGPSSNHAWFIWDHSRRGRDMRWV